MKNKTTLLGEAVAEVLFDGKEGLNHSLPLPCLKAQFLARFIQQNPDAAAELKNFLPQAELGALVHSLQDGRTYQGREINPNKYSGMLNAPSFVS